VAAISQSQGQRGAREKSRIAPPQSERLPEILDH